MNIYQLDVEKNIYYFNPWLLVAFSYSKDLVLVCEGKFNFLTTSYHFDSNSFYVNIAKLYIFLFVLPVKSLAIYSMLQKKVFWSLKTRQY